MPRSIPPAPAAEDSGGYGIGERFMRLAALRISFYLAASAVTAMGAPKALDQGRIHAYYHDGEFDKVIHSLEAFSKSGKTCSSADSVFLEKHLAVVYAANPGTRELGRYHMFRMLDLAPGSDLLDMFVGEEVDGVFDKVRKEHALRLSSNRETRPEVVQPRSAPVKSSWDAVPESSPALSKASLPKPDLIAKASAPVKASSTAPASVSATVPAPRAAVAPAVHAKAGAPAKPMAPARPWWDVNPVTKGNQISAVKPVSSSTASMSGKSSSTDDVALESRSGSSPAWKEPGLWIGGGAALAVVTLALFYSGSADAPSAKTYVVPSIPAH
jgi:hypothetical protein